MNHNRAFASLSSLTTCLLLTTAAPRAHAAVGIFEADGDIGTPAHPGSAQYDAKKQTYTITGGGANMWATNDAFHYVWKKMSGDVSLSADITPVGTEGDAHRKACLVIRQSLDSDSPYVDAALHGNGLVAIQCRDTKGGPTREITSNVTNATHIRIEKHGRDFFMSIATAGDKLHPAGGSYQLPLEGTFYVGLGVCAHDDKVTRQAVFANVDLKEEKPLTTQPLLASTLEIIPITSKDRTAVYFTTNHIEAPNWSKDGTYFVFNGRGHLFKLPVTGGEPTMIDTGTSTKCNNDHGFSPDGTQIAISDSSQDNHSIVYLVPVAGGTPKRITPLGPSYWHGWSPDGKTLAYCGQRTNEFDIYTMSVDGGEEKRLTTATGLDDGPEYSPDGQYIYFNSERSGQMQIWRMHADGSQQEQVTSDDYNNWFAHVSPNGRWLVFLTYEKDVKGHPGSKDVMLRMMPTAGGKIDVLAKLFGGQGTMNVPSWSPDSSKIAFMSYQLIP